MARHPSTIGRPSKATAKRLRIRSMRILPALFRCELGIYTNRAAYVGLIPILGPSHSRICFLLPAVLLASTGYGMSAPFLGMQTAEAEWQALTADVGCGGGSVMRVES